MLNLQLKVCFALILSLMLVRCGSTPQTTDSAMLAVTDSDTYKFVLGAPELETTRKLIDRTMNVGSEVSYIKLTELFAMLPVSGDGLKPFEDAYPHGLAAGCENAPCKIGNMGKTARIKVATNQDDFIDTEVGVKEKVNAIFKSANTDGGGKALEICKVEGFFFAKGPFRKNLVAIRYSVKNESEGAINFVLSNQNQTEITCQ